MNRFGLIALIVLLPFVSTARERLHPEAAAFLERMSPVSADRLTAAIREARKGDTKALQAMRNARGKTVSPTPPGLIEYTPEADGIPLRIYIPRQAVEPIPAVIYFHGGGWTIGSIASCARFCRELALHANVIVIAPDYRLAPEHPYPAASLDAFQTLQWVRRHSSTYRIDLNNIFLGGDSSGGNLAISAALRNYDAKLPPLRGLLLYYPVVLALNDHSESWTKYGKGYGQNADLMEEFNQAYIPSPDNACDRYASPLLTNISGLPPTLLIAADKDILRDQGKLFAKQLADTGVEVRYLLFPGSIHLFITMPGMNNAFDDAVAESTLFISDQLQ